MKISKLNALLGRELGVTPYGDPVFKWEWSEDLFWPAYATGGMSEQVSPSGIVLMVREYKRDRMSHKLDHQWVITHWFPVEVLYQWNENFPGADYPSRGYRIHTDFSMRRDQLPDLAQTEWLIGQIKHQRSQTFTEATNEFEAARDRADKARESAMRAEIRDSFTALLNPIPGKRGGSVSFPDPQGAK